MRIERILFVCLGNICRSPLAEGLFIKYISAQPRHVQIEVDSAGTGDWHVGQFPDPRARKEGEKRGCSMQMKARQITPCDFEIYDFIIALDCKNHADLQKLSPENSNKIHLLGAYSSEYPNMEIPDPYYGDAAAFAKTADLIESCFPGLYNAILDHSQSN